MDRLVHGVVTMSALPGNVIPAVEQVDRLGNRNLVQHRAAIRAAVGLSWYTRAALTDQQPAAIRVHV